MTRERSVRSRQWKQQRRRAEVVVQAKHHVRLEAEETSENMRASTDAAMDKIARQLGRVRDKIHDHRPAMKRAEANRNNLGLEHQ